MLYIDHEIKKVMKALDYFRPDLKQFFTEKEIKNV